MRLEKLIVYVEEASAKEALQILLPKMLSQNVEYQVVSFDCKQELLKRLPERLKGYKRFLPETWKLLILVDRDDDDCRTLKASLEQLAYEAGFSTKSSSPQSFQIVNRIVVEELEAWFFGDWPAVMAAYPRMPPSVPNQAKYRDPDAIRGGTWETLQRLLQKHGYFAGGLRKIELARSVSSHMHPARNRSASFRAFREAIQAAST